MGEARQRFTFCTARGRFVMSALEMDLRGVIVTCPSCGQRNRLAYEKLSQPPNCAKCRQRLSPPSEPIDAPDEATIAALIGRCGLPVLVDFWAPWCGPCKMVTPELAKIAAEGAGRWVAVKLNTEDLPSQAAKYRVNAIPLMIIFKEGREVARQAGAMPASGIRQFLQQHI